MDKLYYNSFIIQKKPNKKLLKSQKTIQKNNKIE